MHRGELIPLVDQWIKELYYEEKAQLTLNKYKSNVLAFFDFVQHTNDITKDDTMLYKEFLKKRYQPSSINSYITIVNKFLLWAGIEEATLKKLRIQVVYSLENVPSVTEYKRMLRRAKEDGMTDMYLIMKTIARTGVRVSELKQFTVETIQKFVQHIRLKGKDRDIPVPQDLIRELRKYCKANKIITGVIFPHSPKKIWLEMKNIATRAKINKEKIYPHALRHLFSKEYLAQNNNDIAELADILGHGSINTTRIYSRTSLNDKRGKLEKMKF